MQSMAWGDIPAVRTGQMPARTEGTGWASTGWASYVAGGGGGSTGTGGGSSGRGGSSTTSQSTPPQQTQPQGRIVGYNPDKTPIYATTETAQTPAPTQPSETPSASNLFHGAPIYINGQRVYPNTPSWTAQGYQNVGLVYTEHGVLPPAAAGYYLQQQYRNVQEVVNPQKQVYEFRGTGELIATQYVAPSGERSQMFVAPGWTYNPAQEAFVKYITVATEPPKPQQPQQPQYTNEALQARIAQINEELQPRQFIPSWSDLATGAFRFGLFGGFEPQTPEARLELGKHVLAEQNRIISVARGALPLVRSYAEPEEAARFEASIQALQKENTRAGVQLADYAASIGAYRYAQAQTVALPKTPFNTAWEALGHKVPERSVGLEKIGTPEFGEALMYSWVGGAYNLVHSAVEFGVEVGTPIPIIARVAQGKNVASYPVEMAQKWGGQVIAAAPYVALGATGAGAAFYIPAYWAGTKLVRGGGLTAQDLGEIGTAGTLIFYSAKAAEWHRVEQPSYTLRYKLWEAPERGMMGGTSITLTEYQRNLGILGEQRAVQAQTDVWAAQVGKGGVSSYSVEPGVSYFRGQQIPTYSVGLTSPEMTLPARPGYLSEEGLLVKPLPEMQGVSPVAAATFSEQGATAGVGLAKVFKQGVSQTGIPYVDIMGNIYAGPAVVQSVGAGGVFVGVEEGTGAFQPYFVRFFDLTATSKLPSVAPSVTTSTSGGVGVMGGAPTGATTQALAASTTLAQMPPSIAPSQITTFIAPPLVSQQQTAVKTVQASPPAPTQTRVMQVQAPALQLRETARTITQPSQVQIPRTQQLVVQVPRQQQPMLQFSKETEIPAQITAPRQVPISKQTQILQPTVALQLRAQILQNVELGAPKIMPPPSLKISTPPIPPIPPIKSLWGGGGEGAGLPRFNVAKGKPQPKRYAPDVRSSEFGFKMPKLKAEKVSKATGALVRPVPKGKRKWKSAVI